MPPRDDQPHAGVDVAIGVGELAGVEVPFEVVDGDQRDVERQGQRLGRGQADDQGADQAGPGRDGDRPEVGQADPGPSEGLVDHRQELADMGPRGDLGDHAPEPLVQVDLRRDHARTDRGDARRRGAGALPGRPRRSRRRSSRSRAGRGVRAFRGSDRDHAGGGLRGATAITSWPPAPPSFSLMHRESPCSSWRSTNGFFAARSFAGLSSRRLRRRPWRSASGFSAVLARASSPSRPSGSSSGFAALAAGRPARRPWRSRGGRGRGGPRPSPRTRRARA